MQEAGESVPALALLHNGTHAEPEIFLDPKPAYLV